MPTQSAKNMRSASSPFAAGLRSLLDDTKFFKRAEWARILDVTPAAISQWVTDKTLPRADLLRQIVDILGHGEGVPAELLARFEELAQRPAEEVSPLGRRMMPSVAQYMAGATIASLGRTLRDLTPAQQRAVLAEGSWPAQESGSEVRAAARSDKKSFAEESLESEIAEDCTDIACLPSLEKITSPVGRREQLRWDSVLSKPRVVIVGTPGSGKSTIMAAILKSAQKRKSSDALFLSAPKFWGRKSGVPFLQLCQEALDLSCSLILIDALDEVEIDQRCSATRTIVEGCHRFSTLRFIIATRPIPELPLLTGFERVSLAPLTGLQMIHSLQRSLGTANPQWLGFELEQFVCHLTERETLSNNARNHLFLRTAASLFERNAITPYSETELIGEYFRCLLDGWERKKPFVRARKPWASPNRLYFDLAALCFHLVAEEKKAFNSTEAKRWLARPNDREWSSQLPSLLSIVSGVFQQTSEDHWQVIHEYFVCYLAAVHIVESSGDATQYLKRLKRPDAVADVFRLACGITSDAAPLLRYLAEEQRSSEAQRWILLFEALAQPILASSTVLEASYEPALAWLDRLCAKWTVVQLSEEQLGTPGALWEFQVTCKSGARSAEMHIPKALKAIHRARTGPAKEFLVKRMKKGCHVLAEFSSAMQVEGRLKLETVPGTRASALRAAVVSPQLV